MIPGDEVDITSTPRIELTAPAAGSDRRSHGIGPRSWRGELFVVGVIAGAGLFALLVAAAAHAVAANSDSATVVLEGRAIAHGNLSLSGWSLSLDSFWSVDAVFYAVGVALVGLGPVVITLVPAAIALLVIVVGAFAARDGLTGKGALVAVLTVVALLGLPSYALAFYFLQGPWHIGTALWCLVAFVALRHGRFDWGWLIGVGFLVAGMLGDLQTVAFGVVPVALGGALAMLRTRAWRAGLSEIAAAAVSVLAALAIRAVTVYFGAFSFHEAHHTSSLNRMAIDLRHLGSWGLSLFGVTRGPVGGPSIPVPIAAAHLVGLVVVMVSVVVALLGAVRGAVTGPNGTRPPAGSAASTEHGSLVVQQPVQQLRPSWRLDDLLLFGCLGDLAVFELLTLSGNTSYARYLTAAVIFAVVLAGRSLGRASARLGPGTLRRTVAALMIATMCGYAADVGLELSETSPRQPVTALDRFLIDHGLTDGVGDYWAASVVTVQTRGAVTIRPIVANAKRLLVRDGRQSDRSWYVGKQFQFLVYQSAPYGRVEASTVLHTFGTPEHIYVIGSYYVAVWGHPITLPPGQFP